MELRINVAWLEDGVVSKREKKKDKHCQQLQNKTESAFANRVDVSKNSNSKQRDGTLKEGKLRREKLKHYYIQTLRNYN